MRALAIAIALLAAPASAQSTDRLIVVGDPVAGAGTVTEVLGVQVAGTAWYAHVATDDPVASECIVIPWGKVIALGDQIPYQSGTPVVEIADSTHEDVFSGSSSTLILRLAPTPGGAADDEVLTCGFGIVVREGDATSSMGPDFPPGTSWGSLFNVAEAPYSGVYLLRGDANDPTWPQGPRGYLAFGGYGGSVCAPYPLEVIVCEGELLPGSQTLVLELFENEGSFRTDRSSSFSAPWRSIFACRVLGPAGPLGAVVLHERVQDVSTLVAVEREPSPVPGRTWGDLASARVDVGGLSSVWALRADLDASDPSTDELIVVDGVKFVQEGDVLEATSPNALTDLGDGPPVIDHQGRMLWSGRWVDATTGTTVEGLFLDRNLLVATGATQVDGATVVALDGETEGLHLEPYGQYVGFLATLDDGTRGAFRIALDTVEGYCTAQTSSSGCKARMDWTGNWASASGESPFVLRAEGVASNVTGLLLYSLTGSAWVAVKGGRLCLAQPIARRVVAPSGGTQPAGAACDGVLQDDFGAWIQSGVDPGLVPGARVFAQFWVRDPAALSPGKFRGSDAVRFQIQP